MIQVRQGFGGTWDFEALDGDGQPLPDVDPDTALEAVVWSGDDREPVVTNTPTWADSGPPDGTFSLSPAETASLDPGEYTVDVYPLGRANHYATTRINILAGPGHGAAPFSYITYGQLLMFAPDLPKLFDGETEQSQFAEARAQGSQEFDDLVLARYQPVPGRSRRYLSADGTAAGNYLAYSDGPNGEPSPSRSELAGWLGTTALVMKADVVECVAHLTLDVIYRGQPGKSNPYQEQGTTAKAQAMDAFRRCIVELDTDDDGTADLRVDQDATWMI
jgi:hypothetical protein